MDGGGRECLEVWSLPGGVHILKVELCLDTLLNVSGRVASGPQQPLGTKTEQLPSDPFIYSNCFCLHQIDWLCMEMKYFIHYLPCAL